MTGLYSRHAEMLEDARAEFVEPLDGEMPN
jgi:hypothetical protein